MNSANSIVMINSNDLITQPMINLKQGQEVSSIISKIGILILKLNIKKQLRFIWFTAELVFQNFQSLNIESKYYEILNEKYKSICPKQIKNVSTFKLTLDSMFKSNQKVVINQSFSQQELQSLITLQIKFINKSSTYFYRSLLALGFIEDRTNYTINIKKSEQKFSQNILNILESQITHDQMQQEQPGYECGNLIQMQTIQEVAFSEQKPKTGGFAKISEVQCRAKYVSNQAYQTKKFACKQFNQQNYKSKVKQQLQRDFFVKLENEKRIITHIVKGNKKNHLLNYYVAPNNDQKLYMDYFPDTLKDYRQYGISIQAMIRMSRQVVKSIIQIHDVLVVHRDIKLSNFLVDCERATVKIIDFGQSTIVNERDYLKQKHEGNFKKLGATLPYSPPQCALIDQSQSNNGYDNLNIDSWSAGVNLHEIIFGKRPITYSKCFSSDILNNWKTQFLMTISKSKRSGIALVEDVFKLISIMTIRIKQKDRMQLQIIDRMLRETQKYLQSIITSIDPQIRKNPANNQMDIEEA